MYDAALVFGVFNGEPPEERPESIRKIYDCRNHGGLDTSDNWACWLTEAAFEHLGTVELPVPAGTALTVVQRMNRRVAQAELSHLVQLRVQNPTQLSLVMFLLGDS